MTDWDEQADFVVVGSGAAGGTAALDLARAGADVVVLEEGGWYRREDFRPDLFSALSRLWRDFGGQVATGRSAFPVAQGCCVGGSTVINGATMHRLPRAAWERWTRDPGVRDALPWDALENAAESLERDLGVMRNLAEMLPDLAMTQTLDRLGWEYQAMARAAPGCQHRRRCLVGCPSGGKASLERSLIPEAVERGARVRAHCRAERIVAEDGRAVGVMARVAEPDTPARRVAVRARRGVVVAAGAVHSPLLLRRSGLRGRHVGRHFQCHIGTAVVAEFDRPVAPIEGPSMGYEIQQFDDLKFNSIQPTPPEIIASNVPRVGRALVALLRARDRVAIWNSSTPCDEEGLVGGWLGLPRIRLTPGRSDIERLREGAYHLSHLLFEAGARTVYPGIHGISRALDTPTAIAAIRRAPLDPRDYAVNVSHIFGTCRLGSVAAESVVDPHFRAHELPGLHVVDASVFPTTIGSNPQLAIMALARHATRGILACS